MAAARMTFKLNGTVNRHVSVYGAPENLHVPVDKASIYQGFVCGVDYHLGGLLGPFLFDATISEELYLEMLRTSILPGVRALYGDD
ncbi:hypothetical protein C0J52_20797 [Blattella germanica]|nr:hypothetical protein C0J52_20797 [Blattella germanica]